MVNRARLLGFVAIAALAGCDLHVMTPGEVTLKEGVRGCTSLSDAARFEEIEQARDWQASMEMLRSGRCMFAAPGDTIVVEKVTLDGSTLFRERGKERSLWTKESIKPAASGAKAAR